MSGDDLISNIDRTNKLITDAVNNNSSDIHIEPTNNYYLIRLRVQGDLQEYSRINYKLSLKIVSRIKVLANLDISNKISPQDGSFKLTINSNIYYFRVSSLATIFGEKIVIRILNNQNKLLSLAKLGLHNNQLTCIQQSLNFSSGLIIFCGTTGSGKTTSLYASLQYLNRSTVNIVSIEDPVEIHLPGINQVQVNSSSNSNFRNNLKAVLRQDPDIIMIGEIRDDVSAKIAIQAANTGHLVLSSLHCNRASQVKSRLINLGANSFDIDASLKLVVSQKLIKTICIQCKGASCDQCDNGYSGRTGIFELLSASQIKYRHLKKIKFEDIGKVFVNSMITSLNELNKVGINIK